MIKAKINSKLLKKIRDLPRASKTVIQTKLKREANEYIEVFRDGIKSRGLQLEQLAQITIESKSRRGLPKPATPLYGKGETVQSSLINSLKIFKTKDGYSVRTKGGTHHSGMTFNQILRIHEFGATIKTSKGSFRIPPRPALSRSFKKYLRQKKKKDPELKKAINKLLSL